MKKKILMLLVLTMIISGLSGSLIHKTAQAEETKTAYQIQITRYPSKTTYAAGEQLDFSDMELTGYYPDGTTAVITDYSISGYDSGKAGYQMITVSRDNCNAYVSINVLPAKVTNIKVTDHSATYLTLTWDSAPDAARYEVYSLDAITGNYVYTASVSSNSITLNYPEGTVHSFQICKVVNENGSEVKSALSDTFTAATDPGMVTGLKAAETSASAVTLTWDAVPGAAGYIIYRSPYETVNFKSVGTATGTTFKNTGLVSGTAYTYKVAAYSYSKDYEGDYSAAVNTSTNAAKMTVKYKAGDQKVRLTWSKVSGADSYEIFMGDQVNGVTLLKTVTGNVTSYIAEGLSTGATYSFYAVAHRDFNGAAYDSAPSDTRDITLEAIEKTSTRAKYFSGKADFLASTAYTGIEFYRKNVNYTKSYVIPGLITTNIDGFSSTRMCPQGLTFAGDYLLLTAYDQAGEENSVIYVLDKSTKKYITTLVLPVKAHIGGISYDGTNVWVTVGSKVCSVPFKDIKSAVAEGKLYNDLKFNTTSSLGISASYITYYDGKLWVGSYNELETTKLYSYSIDDKDSKPELMQEDTMTMPTRVQGIAFTKDGYMIISRSCQLYQGLRGYMRQLDVYKPDFKNEEDDYIKLGEPVNTVEMPSMNEEIAIYGSYLYVNYESAAFDNASYKMDRVSAFKLTSILKKAAK